MDTYYCRDCKRSGCKLWRDYGDASDFQCWNCLDFAGDKNDPTIIEGKRRFMNKEGGSDIGFRVPAVHDNNGNYYSFTAIPNDRSEWWNNLPL